jgi:hypothetical protein
VLPLNSRRKSATKKDGGRTSCLSSARCLLDNLGGRKSWTNLSDAHFHVLARFGLGDEDDETFHTGDTVASAAGFFDVNLVLFTLFNWLVE